MKHRAFLFSLGAALLMWGAAACNNMQDQGPGNSPRGRTQPQPREATGATGRTATEPHGPALHEPPPNLVKDEDAGRFNAGPWLPEPSHPPPADAGAH